MSTQIDQFCEDLRVNMTMIDDNLRAVKAKAVGTADEAERAARQQMDSLQKKIDAAKAAVEAAKPKINKWVEAQKTTAQSKIAEWKAKGDQKSLADACRYGRRIRQRHVCRRVFSSRRGGKGCPGSVACSFRCGSFQVETGELIRTG